MKELKEKKDRKEPIGEGLLTITFLRHSHKGDDGNLDENGIIMAEALNIPIPENSGIKEPLIDPILSEHPYTDKRIEELGLSGGKWLLVEGANRLLAGKIAKFTLDRLDNKKSGKNSQIIAISHVPPIMAFLGYVLANSKGKDFIDQETQFELFKSYGGKLTDDGRSIEPAFVNYLEGFKINYNPERNGLLEISFRNQIILMPITQLQKLFL